jgi:hypothetical protein
MIHNIKLIQHRFPMAAGLIIAILALLSLCGIAAGVWLLLVR